MISVAWYDVLGVAGVAVIVLAFFGLQAGRLRGDGRTYQAMNAAGSLAVLISLVFAFNLPSFVLESLWLLISIYGMARGARVRRESKAANRR